MKLADLKDLEAAIKICRKHGVDIIKIDNIEIVLGKMPEQQSRSKKAFKSTTKDLGQITENTNIPLPELDIPTDELTEDQLLFGSSDPSVWDQ